MNIYYVYAYLRKKDLTPYYIGKGKGFRAYNKSVSVPKDKSKIVFYHTNLLDSDAQNLEKSYIKLFDRKDLGTGILHNRTDGGDGLSGYIMPEERKRKISAQFIGRKFSPETSSKKSAAQTGGKNHRFGKKISYTQSAQISESNRKRTPPNQGAVWWNNGLVNRISKTQPDKNFVRGRLLSTHK